ncbi:MAG: hypothetical protein QM677_11430, partial [Microbacterium sp.]
MTTVTTAAPTLDDIARLLSQSIDEQRDLRARIDAHTESFLLNAQGLEKRISGNEKRTEGGEKRVEGLHDTMNARFLRVDGQLSDIGKRFDRLEDHVGFITTKAVEHDRRFDGIDTRLNGIDTRLNELDTRL